MSDLIKRQDAIRVVRKYMTENQITDGDYHADGIERELHELPSAQKTAKRIVGCGRNGMTMWYQCDMCNEPVDEKDTFCRGCGRRFVHE